MTRHKAAASASGGERPERLRNTGLVSRSRMKLWMIRATTMVLLCTCVVQLAALGETWGPRLLKGWPSCFLREPQQVAVALGVQSLGRLPVRIVPPKRVYENNGFLMVSFNGGLNQMRAARVWEGGWRDRILDWGIAKREKAVNICPQVSPSTRQVLPNPFHDPFLDYLQGRVASYL